MKFQVTNPKITLRHLALLAIVYIRRSSPRQVKEHLASGEYQRSFTDLARFYGWNDNQIVEIDADDGKSGSYTLKRKGFHWIRQQVFEGRVGALVCWDASRLGRDNSDFAQLIKLCAAYGTILIDEKGVYDPNNINDAMYLGIMGVFNSTQGKIIGDKCRVTKRMRAEAGELPLRPATGYVRDEKGHLILDPHKKVQKAIRLLFSSFNRLRSATQVVKHFNRNKIKFPTLKRSRGKKSEIVWGEINVTRVLDILRNPMYAGIYAFGLTKTANEMLGPDTSEQKKKIVTLGLDSDEAVVIHDAHEGYINREQYTENQKILEDNRNGPGAKFRGAVRNGSALLARMVVCGKCLGKLSIHYNGRDGSGVYECVNEVSHFGKYKCLTIAARRLDEIVTNAFFEAVSPAQLQLTLRGLKEVDKETQADDGHEQEKLKSARAECEEARLRFEAIDPRNTLVFKEYEKKLLEKMREVKRLERRGAQALKKSGPDLTDKDLQSLLALPQHLRVFWDCPSVTNVERKQLLRFLISQVVIKRREDSQYQDVIIHWVGGAITPLSIPKDGRFLHPEAVELIRSLAPDHTVSQIVERLHEEGFKSKGGNEWFSPDAVRQDCKAYGIKLACPERTTSGDKPRGDGRYPASKVAEMCHVSAPTIFRWWGWGILDGVRKGPPRSTLWVKITPQQVSAIKNQSLKRISKTAAVKLLDNR